MKKLIPIISSVVILFSSVAFVAWQSDFNENDRVAVLLEDAIGTNPSHYKRVIDEERSKRGKDLVTKGWTLKDGKKSKVISKYFVCTDCHNTVIEDNDILNPTPEGRLQKSMSDGIPFLQGSTFYGMTNRTTWYNEDYVKKYGALVVPAKDTLENATQLCAKVCSSGRYLEAWELEDILHYFNSIDYKVSDLGMKPDEFKKLNNVSGVERAEILNAKFKKLSSATFLDVTAVEQRKNGVNGDVDNGRLVYKQSCLHCHGYERDVAKLKLDTTKVSLKHLKKYVKKNHRFSIYNIVRKGTHAEFAMREYMPHYTAERMSEEQLEDLVSYIIK